MAPGLTQLEIVPFKVAAYNKKEQKMTFFDEHHKEDFEFISGKLYISIQADFTKLQPSISVCRCVAFIYNCHPYACEGYINL